MLIFKVNSARKHYSSADNVGYTVVTKSGAIPTLVRQDGWAATRAAFVKKAMWVVKDVEDSKGGRMWPSGKYVPQTRSDPEDSVANWVKEEASIENEDVLLFVTIGKFFQVSYEFLTYLVALIRHDPYPSSRRLARVGLPHTVLFISLMSR
jgi:Cu2+-containing amine oxidase